MQVGYSNISNSNNFETKRDNKKISFKATPQEIIKATTASNDLCPGKRRFLQNISSYFIGIENQLPQNPKTPDKFVYKLGEKNEIPDSMKKLGIYSGDSFVTLKDFDDNLQNDTFRCSPNSTCSCGKGFSKGEFMANLLTMIGIEKPNEISITKKV